MIEQLFFELIRFALGNVDSLSHIPKSKEWKMLYEMAKKQSLVGICFAGVQKTLSDSPLKGEDPSVIGMPEMLYLTWMGMAAKIQQRNEVVNKQCVGLQKLLATDGLRSSILKGQSVALYYGEHLRYLRQSGDIDVWVDAPREKIVEWARAHGGKDLTGDLHVDCEIFPDTAVELHFTPSIASGSNANKRLQEWFESHKDECMTNKIGSITTPTSEFNQVYLLHHIFRHYLYEGIGLRQIMDYYFVLREASLRLSPEGKREVLQTIKALGMERFVGALLWVIGYVFEGNPEYYKSFPLGEDLGEASKRGKRLLEVVMEGGNFGHSTEKYKITGWDKPWSRLSRYVRRNWYMLWDYPEEIIWNMIKKLKI